MEAPASEIEFWRTYYSFVPFPQKRDDERTAVQTYATVTTLLNVSGVKTQTPITLEMFMPDYWAKQIESRKFATLENEMSEKQLIDAEEEFVSKALASGFGSMQNGT